MAKATIGERVYRRLLRLYPRDFSDDFADEMAHLYRDRVRGEGATSVWLALVADLARTAPREQISTVAQDVRHAWRAWRRTPVLALAAVLTLALGVGANTAVFSIVYGVLLRPLPYPGADRLVEVFEDNTRAGGGPFFRVSLLNYLSWIERTRSFDALAAFNGRDFTVTEHGDPERILGSAITASLFRVLGVAPIVGRPLGPEGTRAPRGARRTRRASSAAAAHGKRLARDGQRRLWSGGGRPFDAGVTHADPGNGSAGR